MNPLCFEHGIEEQQCTSLSLRRYELLWTGQRLCIVVKHACSYGHHLTLVDHGFLFPLHIF